MQKLLLSAIALTLAGCQVSVNTSEAGKTTISLPRPQILTPSTAPAAATTTAGANPAGASTALLPGAVLLPGVYSSQFQSRHKDGKGKLQNESGKYSYTVEDLGGGRARVKFEGEATTASPGGFGGTQSGYAEATGIAVWTNGNWFFSGMNEDGTCESRFVIDAGAVRHLSGRCKDGGSADALGWPADNTVLRLSRPLRDTDHAALQRTAPKAGAASAGTATGASVPAAAGQPAAMAALIGKTFTPSALPYRALGFDAFNEKLDQYSIWGMPGDSVFIYPAHKGNARFLVVAVAAGDLHRISDVRPVAANVASLQLVGPTEGDSDAVTECTLNGKKVRQVIGYLRGGKKNRYAGVPSTQGESMWLLQPGGSNMIALNRGEKMACTVTVFSG